MEFCGMLLLMQYNIAFYFMYEFIIYLFIFYYPWVEITVLPSDFFFSSEKYKHVTGLSAFWFL